MKKISIMASLALASSILFISGCGSSSCSTTSVTGTVSDAYVKGAKVCIDKNNDGICEPNEQIIATTDANGHFTIPIKYKNDNFATIGGTDVATGENVGILALKGGSGKLNITPLTTFIANYPGSVSQAAQALGINEKSLYNDPVTDPSGESTKATLKLNAAKTLSGSTYATLAGTGDTNLTNAVITINRSLSSNKKVVESLFKQIDSLNVKGGDYNSIRTVEQTVVVAAQVAKTGNDVNLSLSKVNEIIKTVDNNVTVNNPIAMAAIVDSVTEALKKGETDPTKILKVVKTIANVVDKNTSIAKDPDAISLLAQTVVDNNETNISSINLSEIVKKATPVSYASNKIQIGNKIIEFTPVSGTNIARFNVSENVTSTTTYQDFANIKLPDVNTSTLEGKDGTYNASLVLTIQDLEADNTVIFRINNAVIDVNNSAKNKFEIKFIPNKTQLVVYQHGLQGLTKIKSNETKIAYVKNELINTDLGFNINTLLNDLSTNSSSIATTLDELNKYLRKSRNYKVILKVDTDLPLKINTLIGNVTINNTANNNAVSNTETNNSSIMFPPSFPNSNINP